MASEHFQFAENLIRHTGYENSPIAKIEFNEPSYNNVLQSLRESVLWKAYDAMTPKRFSTPQSGMLLKPVSGDCGNLTAKLALDIASLRHQITNGSKITL
jgi:hypothetical protein